MFGLILKVIVLPPSVIVGWLEARSGTGADVSLGGQPISGEFAAGLDHLRPHCV